MGCLQGTAAAHDERAFRAFHNQERLGQPKNSLGHQELLGQPGTPLAIRNHRYKVHKGHC